MRNITFFILAIFLSCTGCAKYANVYWQAGTLNVVIKSRDAGREEAMWEYTKGLYDMTDEQERQLQKPKMLAQTPEFVQKAWEMTNKGPEKDLQVSGFYNQHSNLIVYTAGRRSTLVHEYCHALNYQLKYPFTREQDESYCRTIAENYRLQHEVRRLRDDLNTERHYLKLPGQR